MKARITMMAIAAAILVPMTAAAIDVEWSGSYGLTGFLLGEDITSHDTEDGDTQGFYQSLRIAPTFDLGRDVKVHVGLRLYEQYWSGDHRKPTDAGAATNWNSQEGLGLDFGYVEMPAFGGTLRVGRQEANWGHDLTTADDRRDRIAYQYDLADVLGGPLSLLAIYDLRQDIGITDVSSDGHLFAAAAVGYNLDTQILWGLLGGYWAGDADQPLNEEPFLLDSVALVGPFMEGPLGPVDLKFAAHTIFPIDNDRDTFGDYTDDGGFGGYASDFGTAGAYASGESGGLWNSFNGAVMLRPALDFSKVSALQPQVLTVEAQGLLVFNGGLVEPGFDTFSSMIGNAGRNSVNPTNVFNMGGTGYEDDHQLLGAMRVNYELIPGLNAIVAGGMYHFFAYERDVDQSLLTGSAADFGTLAEGIEVRAEITDFFVDLGVEYAVSEQATLFASYGWLGDDTSNMASLAPEEGDPRQQLSAGVRVSY